MRVLIIDHQDSFTNNLSQLLERCGAEVDIVSYESEFSKILSNYDKIVLSPGPGIPDDYPKTLQLIKDSSEKWDILGICLGMQSIAIAFGGKLFKQTKVMHGILTNIIPTQCITPNIMNPFGEFKATLYHSWAVDPQILPNELAITATTDQGTIMGLKHKKYRIEGIQFHPESFQCKVGINILSNWLNRNGWG